MPTAESERTIAEEAAAGGAAKRGYVRRMFSDIAPRYDRVNRIISFRLDQRWRRRAIAALGIERAPAGRYLDLCAGTLDIAAQIARQRVFRGEVLAADFAEPMLRAGLGKIAGRRVFPVTADALQLPFADGVADGAIVVFGIRNVVDLDAALRETHRVLRPGARFVILEFTEPRNSLVRAVYGAYFNHVLPRIGNAVAGHSTAYDYLPRSVAHWPSEDELAARMRRAGFEPVRWHSLTFGVVAIHVGEKRVAALSAAA